MFEVGLDGFHPQLGEVFGFGHWVFADHGFGFDLLYPLFVLDSLVVLLVGVSPVDAVNYS